jgi:2-polyprenyl-3-methyl-5-hydroxy-6-metoxy-1,4-benzoquinol methylase
MGQHHFSIISQTLPQKSARIYSNQGNGPLIDLMPPCSRVLDVGCGVGDNARLIRARMPDCAIYGITLSEAEAQVARQVMSACCVLDLEGPEVAFAGQYFDVLLFSHVLEHLRDPADVLMRYLDRLVSGGWVLIAVPNILSWRMRIQFLRGEFEYGSAGVLDDTHLRFFTYFTADRFLLAKTPNLQVVSKTVTGSFPLWWLRRHVLPTVWSERIDRWACRHWPNLFGGQILIKAVKK